MTREEKALKAWRKEKKMIPVMIGTYCRGVHKTKGKELCASCKELMEYALYRLEKCPFKVDKKFCTVCKIHCYKPEMREKIRAVMRYAGPRMIVTHPIYAFSHVAQVMRDRKRKGVE